MIKKILTSLAVLMILLSAFVSCGSTQEVDEGSNTKAGKEAKAEIEAEKTEANEEMDEDKKAPEEAKSEANEEMGEDKEAPEEAKDESSDEMDELGSSVGEEKDSVSGELDSMKEF